MKISNVERLTFFKRIDHFCINILPFILLYELVLGGSGRVIMLTSQITIRYFLFFIAMLYYLLVILRDIFVDRLSIRELINKRINRTLVYLLIFFTLFLFAILNGYRNGNPISDIFESSKGILYILMLFPFSLFVDSKDKAKKLVKAFINATVILAIITFVIFIIYGLYNESYNVFGVLLNKWSYGYIALRSGFPAVFMKTSPYMAVALIYELNMFINGVEKKTKRKMFNIFILLEGIICTMSMGIWIASSVGFALVLLVSILNRKNIKTESGKSIFVELLPMIVVVVITQIIFNQIFDDYIVSVIDNRIDSADSSFVVKSDQLIKLTSVWLENIFFGKGYGVRIFFELGEFRSESMILFELFWNQLLVNMGLVGFVSYILLIFEPVLVFFRGMLKKRYKGEDVIFILSLSIGIFMMCIISTVNPFMNNPIGIGYLVLFLSTMNLYREE
ncbi:MAG: hypothetical protein WBI17_03805 [Clostridiaceae bacterium]